MPLFSKKVAPTQITRDLEKISDQQKLDWGLLFQVCERINTSALGAKEARKYLQKKMLADETKTQAIALEVLNALTENARDKFKDQLAAKTFGEDLSTLAAQKMDDQVHSKLIQCLTNWVNYFGSEPGFEAICRVHERMVHGIPVESNHRFGKDFFKPYALPPSITLLPAQATGYQRPVKAVDIMADVEIAKNNAQLFAQTLSFTDPTEQDITKNELIQEFFVKCRTLQRLMAGHLQTCDDPEEISALIFANGELVNTFKTYDDMLERRALDAATNNSRAVNHPRQDETLIDTETSAASSQTLDPFASSASTYHGSALPLTPQKLYN